MRWQIANTNNLNTGFGDRVVVLDCTAADADGADEHSLLIDDRQTTGKSNETVTTAQGEQ